MARLRQKDIKKDHMVIAVNRLAAILLRYWRHAAAVGGAILLAVLVVLAARSIRSSIETRAAEAYFRLSGFLQRSVGVAAAGGEKPFASEDEKEKAIAEAAGEVVKRYPRSAAADKALLAAGNYLYHQGKYDRARGCFERYAAGYADREFAANAQEGIGYCLEEAGRWPQAAEAFARVRGKFPGSPRASASLLEEARCYEAMGKWDLARGRYKNFQTEYPEDPLAQEAASRLEWIASSGAKGPAAPPAVGGSAPDLR